VAFEVGRRIGWSEVDLAGVMYYPKALHLAHETFEKVWPTIFGKPYRHIIEQMDIGFPTVRVEAEWNSPLYLDDEITIQLSVENIGTSSVTWSCFFLKFNGSVCWHGNITTACVKVSSFSKIEIPGELKRALQKIQLSNG